MRSFPEQDQEGHLSQIVEQLCDLLDSNEGILFFPRNLLINKFL